MLKKIVLASALVAGSALAQQNVDISGANFQSGAADAALAELGRKAAAEGNRLIITAPPEWHARIAAKVRAGGPANVVVREGFYETVLVRVQPAAPAASAEAPARAETAAALEAASKARAEAEIARAEAERSRADAERAKAEAERLREEAERARQEVERARQAAAEADAARAAASAAPAPVAAPAAAPTPAAAAPASQADGVDAARARLQQALNAGRAAAGTLTVGRLESGDTLYVDGPVRAVTRREGRALVLYWLDGDLDLRRTELRPLGNDRYQVLALIRGEGKLRDDSAGAADLREPASDAASRRALEEQLNSGRTVTETLSPARLVKDDTVYVNGDSALVVRRIGGDIARYWLVGSIDFSQPGIQVEAPNRYKVLSDTVR